MVLAGQVLKVMVGCDSLQVDIMVVLEVTACHGHHSTPSLRNHARRVTSISVFEGATF
jgi:hypothetical protein